MLLYIPEQSVQILEISRKVLNWSVGPFKPLLILVERGMLVNTDVVAALTMALKMVRLTSRCLYEEEINRQQW